MNAERIGYVSYKLYRTGWQNAVCQHIPPLQHLLLSSLIYYRRGFADGLECRKLSFLRQNHQI